MYKEDLALNNLKWLICRQTKPNLQFHFQTQANIYKHTHTLLYIYIYIYIYNSRKNPRGMSIQFKCSMPTAIDCIINLGLKIHQNSCADQKYFLYENKNKKLNSLAPLWIYFRSMMILFRWWKKNIVLYLNSIFLSPSEECHHRPEINL